MKDSNITPEELESRMVQLIIQFMNKSSILSLKDVVDDNLTAQQQALRRERILNVTHEIYKRF